MKQVDVKSFNTYVTRRAILMLLKYHNELLMYALISSQNNIRSNYRIFLPVSRHWIHQDYVICRCGISRLLYCLMSFMQTKYIECIY